MNKLLIRFYRTSSKFNLNLTSDLEEIIIGLMLGDLHAEKLTPNSNTRLQFKQSIKNKNYIDHFMDIVTPTSVGMVDVFGVMFELLIFLLNRILMKHIRCEYML